MGRYARSVVSHLDAAGPTATMIERAPAFRAFSSRLTSTSLSSSRRESPQAGPITSSRTVATAASPAS